jgi:hypothetical protein
MAVDFHLAETVEDVKGSPRRSMATAPITLAEGA